MENKDKYSIGISLLSLIISLSFAAFSYKQYSLNASRDQREQQTRFPVFEQKIECVRAGRLWKFSVTMIDRTDVRVTIKSIKISGVEGVRLALPDGGGGHLNPVENMTPINPNILEPQKPIVWNGYIIVDDQYPSGSGKIVNLKYEFYLADIPDKLETKEIGVPLPVACASLQ